MTLQILRSDHGGSWYLYEHVGLWHGVENPGELAGLGHFNGRERRTADVIRSAGRDPEAVRAVQSGTDPETGWVEQIVTFEEPDDGIERPEPLDLYGQGISSET